MRCLILLSLVLIRVHVACAQFPYPKQELAAMANERKLAVQLLTPTTEVEVALNSVLKEAFMEIYMGEAEFYAPDDLNKVLRKGPGNYVVLRQPESLPDDIRLDLSYVDGSYHQWILGRSSSASDLAKMTLEEFAYGNITLDYYQFILYAREGKKEKKVTSITFANGKLGKHDYLFLAQQLNLLLTSSADGIMRANFVHVEDNIDRIKLSTCYFLSDYFDAETLSTFQEYYDHPYEVVNFAEYQDVILNQTSGASYVKIIFSFQHNKYMWVIVNGADGRVLALNDVGDYKFTGTFAADELIKPRHLKYSLNLDTQLLNNYYNK